MRQTLKLIGLILFLSFASAKLWADGTTAAVLGTSTGTTAILLDTGSGTLWNIAISSGSGNNVGSFVLCFDTASVTNLTTATENNRIAGLYEYTTTQTVSVPWGVMPINYSLGLVCIKSVNSILPIIYYKAND